MTQTDSDRIASLEATVAALHAVVKRLLEVADRVPVEPLPGSPAFIAQQTAERSHLDRHLVVEQARQQASGRARRAATAQRALALLDRLEQDRHIRQQPASERAYAILDHLETACPAGADPVDWRAAGKAVDGCCQGCCSHRSHDHRHGAGAFSTGRATDAARRLQAIRSIHESEVAA